MASNINPANPIAVSPTTASVRANFQTAHDEISALQTATTGGPFLPLIGGTLTGALVLAGSPTATLQAASKGYVDSNLPAPANSLPIMDSAAAIGTLTTYARADHIHASDTSRYAASNPAGYQTAAQVTATLGGYLPLAGGTVTGNTIFTAGGCIVSGGQFTIQAFGAGSAVLQLYDNGGGSRGQCYWSQSNDAIVLSNHNGSNINLITDVQAVPAAGHNFIVTPGQGYQAGGGSWAALSDARIKTVLGEYEAGLPEVLALRPVRYVYKGNEALREGDASMHREAAEQTIPFVGLVAQEAETVLPGMVGKRDGWIDGEPVDDLRTLNNSELVYALVNAVKQLASRVAALEPAALEGTS
jgi:hypothetical protein